ncbi:MAG TPA: TIGR03621 family F420-dependent LLM class oxidoreductase [Candidatus Limnocylindria bacterium]
MKPFHFLADARAPMPARALAERARHAEAVGYHAFAIPDHVMDQMSPVPAMAAFAAVTERLRVMPFVLNNDLRHPAVVAQDLASIDVLSEGRLDVAIGAGWNRAEYDALGIAFVPQRVRSERLAEAVAVLKGCFGDGPFSFEGRYYSIHEHDGGPKPAQRPHPPLMIGGGGRRTLTLAAREAQIVGLAPRHAGLRDAYSITWEAAVEKVGWVREAAGERFDSLTLNIYPTAIEPIITDDARGEARRVAELLAPTSTAPLTEDQVLDSPHLFIGSLAGLEEKFLRLREELGISSIMVGEPGPLDPIVERLAGT